MHKLFFVAMRPQSVGMMLCVEPTTRSMMRRVFGVRHIHTEHVILAQSPVP